MLPQAIFFKTVLRSVNRRIIMTGISTDFSASRVEVYLGLGANTGSDPRGTLLAAFDEISGRILSEADLSPIFITAPRDVFDQPDFFNASCRGKYSGSPLSLLKAVNEIEYDLGRRRSAEQRRGPRPIDIDILLFGNFTVSIGSESEGEGCWLRVPHQRLRQRLFALAPMLALNPGLLDPSDGSSYALAAAGLSDQYVKILK